MQSTSAWPLGNFWWNDDDRIAVEGTATQELKGNSANDLINNVRIPGRFRGKDMKELQLNFAFPGAQPWSGEIKLKLQQGRPAVGCRSPLVDLAHLSPGLSCEWFAEM